jgi:hypothetical protein
MSDLCYQGTTVPLELIEEPCNGDYTSTACISSPVAITALNLPVNATQQQINNALVLAIQNLSNQIAELTARVVELETP